MFKRTRLGLQEDATRSLANYGKHRIGVLIFFLELKISEPYLQATINTKRRSDCFLSTTPEVRLIGQTRGVHFSNLGSTAYVLLSQCVSSAFTDTRHRRIMQIFVKTYDLSDSYSDVLSTHDCILPSASRVRLSPLRWSHRTLSTTSSKRFRIRRGTSPRLC